MKVHYRQGLPYIQHEVRAWKALSRVGLKAKRMVGSLDKEKHNL